MPVSGELARDGRGSMAWPDKTKPLQLERLCVSGPVLAHRRSRTRIPQSHKRRTYGDSSTHYRRLQLPAVSCYA